MENYGRRPKLFEITSEDVRVAIADNVKTIYQGIRSLLEKTPPDIVSDISVGGMYLTGGGSLLYGMKEYFESKLGIKVNLYETPARSVAKGTAIASKFPKLTQNGDYQYRALQDLVMDDESFGEF
jgi:rod shape-determining protein MreB